MRELAKKYQEWLWGAYSPFSASFINKKKVKKYLAEGIIDRVLSGLCTTGQPYHIPSAEYSYHLNNRFGYGTLKKITRESLEHHLSPVGHGTIYYVGSASKDCRYLLPCIDIDDKGGVGDAPALADFLLSQCPLLKDSYIERSPGGSGVHIYFLLFTLGEDHAVINTLLKDFAYYLRSLIPANSFFSIIDSLKGTFPILEKNNGSKNCISQGLLVSLPRPRNASELTSLTSLKEIWAEDLSSLLKNTISPDPPSSSLIYSDSCVPRGTSGVMKRGRIDEMLDSPDGIIRKTGALFRLQEQLGRVPSFEEYEQYYYDAQLVRNPKKSKPQRRKDLAHVYKDFIWKYDPAKAKSNGFAPEDYAFVKVTPDDIPLLIRKMGKKKITDEIVQVVVHLTEHPVIKDQQQSHYFTVGYGLIRAFCQRLFKEGRLKASYSSKTYLSVSRQIAEHYGWIECIGGYAKGQSKRIIPGPSHPRRKEFMEKYGNLVAQVQGLLTADLPKKAAG